jgi:hypothetical protein
LIFSHQITRKQALEELCKPLYDLKELEIDLIISVKKCASLGKNLIFMCPPRIEPIENLKIGIQGTNL